MLSMHIIIIIIRNVVWLCVGTISYYAPKTHTAQFLWGLNKFIKKNAQMILFIDFSDIIEY